MNKSRILYSYCPSPARTSQLPEESFRQFNYPPFLLKGLLKKGSFHTRWGQPEEVTILDNGLIHVSTSTHGGFFVPDSLRESLPSDHFLRTFKNKFGEADQCWFEEDIDWTLVALTFPDIFSRESFERAEILAKNSFPEAYEQYIGRELLPGESRGKDRKAALHSIKDNVCIFEEFALDSPKAKEIWPALADLADQSKHLVCVKCGTGEEYEAAFVEFTSPEREIAKPELFIAPPEALADIPSTHMAQMVLPDKAERIASLDEEEVRAAIMRLLKDPEQEESPEMIC